MASIAYRPFASTVAAVLATAVIAGGHSLAGADVSEAATSAPDHDASRWSPPLVASPSSGNGSAATGQDVRPPGAVGPVEEIRTVRSSPSRQHRPRHAGQHPLTGKHPHHRHRTPHQPTRHHAGTRSASLHAKNIRHQARATRPGGTGTVKRVAPRGTAVRPAGAGDPRTTARSLLPANGFSVDQFGCLDRLWTKESGWNPNARNRSSGAYGIPQALPAGKLASAGSDWRTNPRTQIQWGLSYIKSRYGTPCAAWRHSQRTNWY